MRARARARTKIPAEFLLEELGSRKRLVERYSPFDILLRNFLSFSVGRWRLQSSIPHGHFLPFLHLSQVLFKDACGHAALDGTKCRKKTDLPSVSTPLTEYPILFSRERRDKSIEVEKHKNNLRHLSRFIAHAASRDYR